MTVTIPLTQIAELERANYAATVPSAEVTPGLDVLLRDDVLLTWSTAFPTHDSNHACLLRTGPEKADDLIDEVEVFFTSKDLPVAVYVSPACTPADLPQRLAARGFRQQRDDETWMILENLEGFQLPAPHPNVSVRPVTADDTRTFAEVFLASFEWPSQMAPILADLLRPGLELANTHHYLAFTEGKPVGTCSLLRHERYGVLGSTGVLSEYRRGGTATNLAIRALSDARERGVDTVMLQTTADTWLERFLRMSGFERAFTRICFLLPYDASGQD